MSNRQYVHLAERQTKMEGFCIPVGAIFGRRKINNKSLFWVSLCPSEISLKNESRKFSLWVNSGNDWKKVSVSFRGLYEPIRSDMVKICQKINGFPVVEKWQRPVRPVITQADRIFSQKFRRYSARLGRTIHGRRSWIRYFMGRKSVPTGKLQWTSGLLPREFQAFHDQKMLKHWL